MRYIKKSAAGVFLLSAWLFIAVFYMPQTAYAYSEIDTDSEGSLEITYECPEAVFSIFRVADVSKTQEYMLTGDFSDCPVSLENLDSAGWRQAAETLEAYVVKDGIKPLLEGKTDKNGSLLFKKLIPGLYLVTGKTVSYDGYTYVPMTFLVSIPNLTADGQWDYEPAVLPKFEKKPVSPEKPPETEPSETEPSETESSETEPLETEPSETESSEAEPPQTGGGQNGLPQTGQLWWPVPLLLISGMILLVVGIVRRKKRI